MFGTAATAQMNCTSPTPKKLTPAECGERLSVGVETIYAWIRNGELPAMNAAKKPHGRPTYRIDQTDLENFQERRRVCKTDPQSLRRRQHSRRPKVKDYFS